MNTNLTEMVFILDRSGSMSGLERDTIGGFNSLIEKQQAETGEAVVSTILFDHETEVIHDRIDVRKVTKMTEKEYYVRGCTALMDAVGGAISHISSVQKNAPESMRPGKTVFVIITDGYENSSREYTQRQVRKMIEKQKKEQDWEFMFLGANIDAVKTAGSFGINEDRAVNYVPDARGTQLNFSAVSAAVGSIRQNGSVGREWKRDIEADYNKRK